MKNNVRRITDGAMIVAIMGLLTVIDGQSGMLLDGLLFWFIPIPIVLYTVKYSLSDGIIIAVSTTLLSFIISLPHLAVLMGFSSIIGLAYGYGINKKKSMYIKRLGTIYDHMKKRCYDKENKSYKYYGNRGIKICNEWLLDRKQFYKWAFENGYNDNLTLDRIDVNKDYCPDNCRWITLKEQQINKTKSLHIR